MKLASTRTLVAPPSRRRPPAGALRGKRAGCIFAIPLFFLAALAGCDRGPAMHTVEGQVLYPDGSVPRGGVAVVRFQPSQESTAEIRKGASGAILPDGSFELWTHKTGDGVYEGEYTVTFAIQKGVMDSTPYITDKYTNPSTTPYNVKVDRDIDDLKFEVEPLPGAPRASSADSD